MATHDFFATITQIFDFFASLKFTKVGKFVASVERLKTKSASASGWLRPPDPLTSYTRSLNLLFHALVNATSTLHER